jgi:hypothetical protein
MYWGGTRQMPAKSESERQKESSIDTTSENEDGAIMVDAIVLDYRTQERVDALLEYFHCPDPRPFGLSSAALEDRTKHIWSEGRTWGHCTRTADLLRTSKVWHVAKGRFFLNLKRLSHCQYRQIVHPRTTAAQAYITPS